MSMGWSEDPRDLDLRDYKIIAEASGEWGGVDAYEARERIRSRHEAETYQGGA